MQSRLPILDESPEDNDITLTTPLTLDYYTLESALDMLNPYPLYYHNAQPTLAQLRKLEVQLHS